MLRFCNDAPSEWKWEKIGKLSIINPSAKKLKSEELVTFLGMANVSEAGKIIGGSIRPYQDVKTGYTSFEDGDVLVAKITPCFENGKGALVHGLKNGCGFGSTEFHVLRAMPNIIPEFLEIHTRTHQFRKRGEINMIGTAGQKRVPTDYIRDYYIPVPSITEQQKITEIIKSWDSAIDKTECLLAIKQRQKQSILVSSIFLNKPDTALENFLKPTLRPVPKPNSGYRALGIRSHGKGTFQRMIDDPRKVDMEVLYEVKAKDLIVNITFAWEGAVAIVKSEDEGCLVSHRFPTYEIAIDKAYTPFIRHTIRSKHFKNLMDIISPGGAGRNRVLNKKHFLKQKVWLPDLKRQKFLGDLLDHADQEIDTLEKYLQLLKTQKHSLMKKLLTGQWRVKGAV